jgi:hypothetical protein
LRRRGSRRRYLRGWRHSGPGRHLASSYVSIYLAMTDTKLARRVQVFLGPAASEALDWIAGETGGITSAIETALLVMVAEREQQGAAQKKADRASRTAELQKSVSAGLAAGTQNLAAAGALSEEEIRERQDGEGMVNIAPHSYCPRHRPRWCEPTCPHRVSA